MDSHAESEEAERCYQCGQKVIEIDNRGMRLVGVPDLQSLGCRRQRALDTPRRRRPKRPPPIAPSRVAIENGDQKEKAPTGGSGLGPSRFLCGTE